MADLNPLSWWRRFLALPNDSRTKTFGVAFLVAAVAAVAVAVTAVSLKPLQTENAERRRQAQLQDMLASVPGLEQILADTHADTLETRIVDLEQGVFADDVDPASFEADPERSFVIAPSDDIAGIVQRPDLTPVHLVDQDGDLLLLVLPVYGSGYQSTIRAYVVLENDFNTIAALTIYEQGETPGLGTRITEPAWQDQWAGKQVADDAGTLRINVVREGSTGIHEVDGITGATRSSTGVGNLVRFWLGENGYGPFLTNLRDGNISP